MCRKDSLQPKGGATSKDALLRHLWGRIHLGYEMSEETWRFLRYTKYRLWTRQIKMTNQRKTGRNAPYKWFKLPHGHNSGNLPEFAHVPIHMYCTFFLLINTFLASLLSMFLVILFHKSEGPGPLAMTTGLVARIWCFHHCKPAPTSGWEPKTCSKLL